MKKLFMVASLLIFVNVVRSLLNEERGERLARIQTTMTERAWR